MSAAAEISWVPPDSEMELRSAFHRAPFGLARCQPHGAITLLNPAMERMFGNGAVLGRSLCFADLLHADDKVAGERLLRELFSGKRNTFQFDSRNPAASGQAVRWTAWRVCGSKSEPDHALLLLAEQVSVEQVSVEQGSAEQVSSQEGSIEQAPAEQAHEKRNAGPHLRQAHGLEAVGRLAGGVAHDFNNLLTGVLLYCDLLMSGFDTDARARKYVEEIRNAGIQATGLVRQLLAVARPNDSGVRVLSLNEIVDGMRGLLLRLIGENIKLEFRLDPGLGLIAMEHTQAQQILLNLVLNARDAMPAGGQINVETDNCRVQVLRERALADAGPPESGPPESGPPESESENSATTSLPCALFTVEDNGSGMDAATRVRAFEAFFTTKGGEGTGLGLATVHDIVTSNGGLIYIDSLPKRGTRVSVLLPLVVPPGPANTAISQEAIANLPERKEGVLQSSQRNKKRNKKL